MYVNNKSYLEKLALKITPHANVADYLHSGLSSGKINMNAIENALANKRLDPAHVESALGRYNSREINGLSYSIDNKAHNNLGDIFERVGNKTRATEEAREAELKLARQNLLKDEKYINASDEEKNRMYEALSNSGSDSNRFRTRGKAVELEEAEKSFSQDPAKHLENLRSGEEQRLKGPIKDIEDRSPKETAKTVIQEAKSEPVVNSEEKAKNVIQEAKSESSGPSSSAPAPSSTPSEESSDLAKNVINDAKDSNNNYKPYAIGAGVIGAGGLGAYLYNKKNRDR